MAQHINSVSGSNLPKVDRAGFYSACRGGDLICCSGLADISKVIENETGSCLSHVLKIFTLPWISFWLIQESVDGRGCRVGLLSDYVDAYDGNLVLCRRPALTLAQIEAELTVGFTLLDDTYDAIEEVSMASRKLLHFLPTIKPQKQLFCSGYMEAQSLKTIPFVHPASDPDWLSPEQIYIDPSVEAVCALIRVPV